MTRRRRALSVTKQCWNLQIGRAIRRRGNSSRLKTRWFTGRPTIIGTQQKRSYSIFKNILGIKSFTPIIRQLVNRVYDEHEAVTADPKQNAEESFPVIEKEYVGIIDAVATEVRIGGAKDALLSSWSNGGGHAYVFAYQVMPRDDINNSRVLAALYNVLALSGTTIKELENDAQDVTLATGDQICLERKYKLHASNSRFKAVGQVVYTKPKHALNGILAHNAVKTVDGMHMMLRLGGGRYPIPIFNQIVDGLNPTLGTKLWQLTDWFIDLNYHGEMAFRKHYGEQAYSELMSLLESNEYRWAERKSESFLGMGEDVFLGNEHGDFGPLFKGAVNMGVGPRFIQEYNSIIADVIRDIKNNL